MQLPAAGLEPNASADGKERMHQCERLGELLLKNPQQPLIWPVRPRLFINILLRLQPANQDLDALLLRVDCRSRFRRFGFRQRTIEIACG